MNFGHEVGQVYYNQYCHGMGGVSIGRRGSWRLVLGIGKRGTAQEDADGFDGGGEEEKGPHRGPDGMACDHCMLLGPEG